MPHSARPIRVLIVDDHPLMREALAAAVRAEPGFAVAGEAANGVQALDVYRRQQPDVVIMDLMMPLRDGVAATIDILAEDPDARILVLTSATDDERVLQALTAGAHGYLVKEADRSQLLEGVRKVAAGDLYLPPATTGKLVRALQQAKSPDPLPVSTEPVLSQRQNAVLALAAAGLSDEQIAGRMMVSETTVRVHFHHLMVKLGMPDRATAIAWYAEQQRR